MYATVRRYKNARALGDAMASRSGEVKELLTSVPGFVSITRHEMVTQSRA